MIVSSAASRAARRRASMAAETVVGGLRFPTPCPHAGALAWTIVHPSSGRPSVGPPAPGRDARFTEPELRPTRNTEHEATRTPRGHPAVPRPSRCRRSAPRTRPDALSRLCRVCPLDDPATPAAALERLTVELTRRSVLRRHSSGSLIPRRRSRRFLVPHAGHVAISRATQITARNDVRQNPQVRSTAISPKRHSTGGIRSTGCGLMASTVRRAIDQAVARVSILGGWAASQASMSASFDRR